MMSRDRIACPTRRRWRSGLHRGDSDPGSIALDNLGDGFAGARDHGLAALNTEDEGVEIKIKQFANALICRIGVMG